MGVGAPILIIMPLLIVVPRLYLRVRGKSVPEETRLRLQKFSYYWTERFAFSLILWLNFIAFIAGTSSINSFPSPGTACNADPGNPFVLGDANDPKALCYSSSMNGAHTLSVVVVLVICVLFPLFQWRICRTVNYLGLEDEVISETFLNRYGMIYAPMAGGWRRYWGLVVYFNTSVLIGTLSLWLSNDPNFGLPVSNIVVCCVVMLAFLLLHPSGERRDDWIESYFLGVQVASLALQIVASMQDADGQSLYQVDKNVREPCLGRHALAFLSDSRAALPKVCNNSGCCAGAVGYDHVPDGFRHRHPIL
jgi:hypothetical protein